MIIPALEYYLVLGAALFIVGLLGVLVRRNLLIVFMSIELILLGANVTFVGFAVALDNMLGQAFVVFSLTVAAAEAAVGLAIIVALSRHRDTLNVDEIDTLKG
jgi:NADH-quinone oxidoreductase subunit K